MWLSGKAWDFQMYQSTTGWQTQLTPWCTRPVDSEVFNYARSGQCAQLMEALSTGKASLYDRDPYGETLLAVSAYSLLKLPAGG